MRPVAVLMAVYHRDDPVLFERALQSVFAQTIQKSHAIRLYLGVDGPIPLALGQIIEAHRDHIYQVIRNPVSVGLARTLNALIAARSDEEFFFRMDADDYSFPNRFQKQLDHFLQFPELDIVGTDIIEVDVETGSRRQIHFADDPNHARRSICRRVPVAHPTVCFRARVFDKVKAYPDHTGNEDIAMWFTCLRAGFNFGNVPIPLLEFTIGRGFWNRRGLDKSLGEFWTYVHGIWSLWGFNWRLCFPVVRLMIRFFPQSAKRLAYRLRA